MQISINVGSFNDKSLSKTGPYEYLRSLVCETSLKCITTIIVFLFGFLVILYVCRDYTNVTLIWLERQDTIVIYLVIVVLFTLVSFPVSIGYIVVVVACGYLFGIVIGLFLSIIGANIGLSIAHNLMKTLGRYSRVRSFLNTETAQAILRVISGPSSFRIIFCARLTPIPFGLQNSIFAFSSVNGKVYHVASILGLIPGQIVGIYVGSSLRSMQDVLGDQQISTFTYVFAAGQLVFAMGLLVWLGSKARKELAAAIAADQSGDKLSNISDYTII